MPQDVSARIRGQWGARPDARTRSCPTVFPVQAGEAAEGPGRENSLTSLGASLTNSPKSYHLNESGPSGGFNHFQLRTVAAFGFSTAAAGVLAR